MRESKSRGGFARRGVARQKISVRANSTRPVKRTDRKPTIGEAKNQPKQTAKEKKSSG